jgi:hypothetical protein
MTEEIKIQRKCFLDHTCIAAWATDSPRLKARLLIMDDFQSEHNEPNVPLLGKSVVMFSYLKEALDIASQEGAGYIQIATGKDCPIRLRFRTSEGYLATFWLSPRIQPEDEINFENDKRLEQ